MTRPHKGQKKTAAQKLEAQIEYLQGEIIHFGRLLKGTDLTPEKRRVVWCRREEHQASIRTLTAKLARLRNRRNASAQSTLYDSLKKEA